MLSRGQGPQVVKMSATGGQSEGHVAPPEPMSLDTLNFVVNFLHSSGFHKAHSALLQEFSTRLNPTAEGALFAAARTSVSACSAPPSTSEYVERALEALSPPRSKSAQAGPSW